MDRHPHVVILGGGFGGLAAAKRLRNAPVQVTLIDKSNHHLFQPLLYQVATCGLSATDIAEPIRKILRKQQNATVLMADVAAVEAGEKRLRLASGETLEYDYLLLAAGATHSYFGKEEWARYAPGLKQIEDALEIRRRVLLAYEQAEQTDDPEARRAWLTFVVIGAGPTGAELAGALAELSRHTLVRDFRNFDPKDAHVLLLEGSHRVLPPYPKESSRQAAEQLRKLGVEVRTDTLATRIDEDGVVVGEERIRARTVLWAAGVAASPLGATLGAPLDRAGRVKVAPDLSVPGHPEIFAVGDMVSLEQGGKPVPGVAPAAIQMGLHAARNIQRALGGEPTEPFRYRDKGSMATLGRKAAVAVLGKFRLSGFPAWMAWLLVHIVFLIGFRNRFVVLFEWALNYFAYKRSARLILHEPALPKAPDTPSTKDG
jgi:NADH dehydrogenase